MKKILIVTVITLIFILYLFQHRCSIKYTQELARLEKTEQLLKDEITALEGNEAKVFLFINLEDIARKNNLIFPKKSRVMNNALVSPVKNPNVSMPVKGNQTDISSVNVSSDSNSHE